MNSCSVTGCTGEIVARGWCRKHYSRWQRTGSTDTVRKPYDGYLKPRCSVDGCDREMVARRLCDKHYQRWKKFGDPLVVKIDREQTDQERFWSKVNKDGPIPEYWPELGQCWIWTTGLQEGYGAFSIKYRRLGAHVAAYEWEHGSVPDGCELDHLCRVRACVRPSHLEAVDHWTNVARGASPHGFNASVTECPQKHPYDAMNTRINKKGSRVCITCERARSLRYYYSRRDAAKAAS
jgi:hypothetical protein